MTATMPGRTDGWLRAPVNFGEYDGTAANCVTSPQSSCIAFTPQKDASSLPVPSAGGPVTSAEDGSVWIVHRQSHGIKQTHADNQRQFGKEALWVGLRGPDGHHSNARPQRRTELEPGDHFLLYFNDGWAPIQVGLIRIRVTGTRKRGHCRAFLF